MVANSGCHPQRLRGVYVCTLCDGSIRQGVLNLFCMSIVTIDQFFEEMTPEERESYANGPKVLGKIEIVECENPRAICYHNPQEDTWEDGLHQCNKCGRYYA